MLNPQYFRRKGIGTRFKSGAVVPWLEGKEADVSEVDSIPMARGYRLANHARRTNSLLDTK
jgi:hypothetical protein